MFKGALTFLLCACAPVSVLPNVPPSPATVIRSDAEISPPTPRKEEVFENSSVTCAHNDTCDLKKIIFRREHYVISPNPVIPGDSVIMSTRILAGIVTRGIEDLTQYAWVQYTRGCMWYSSLNDESEIETEFGVVRDFLGISRIQHVFPRWVIDSEDSDPAYASGRSAGDRFYYLQSPNAIPRWIPDRQGRLFGEEQPTIPFAYITDNPGPAHFSPIHQMATNMSLEFRTCLFKVADVPLETDGLNPGPEKAIRCFDWDSKFVFDHTAQAFKSPSEISGECKRPFSPRERNFHLRQLGSSDNNLKHPR